MHAFMVKCEKKIITQTKYNLKAKCSSAGAYWIKLLPEKPEGFFSYGKVNVKIMVIEVFRFQKFYALYGGILRI